MARNYPSQTSPPGLPNEILIEIVSPLCTSDLRRIGRANRRLHSFIGDYLARYRYNVGLVALPNGLILEIVQHLGRQEDRSRLARASSRLYPLVMDYIVRHNVRSGESSLLNYAAKKDLKGMARTILHLGGDVNTQSGFRPGAMDQRLTPLAIAAFHGHEKMASLLLEAGASRFVNGMGIPLAIAIFKRLETLALVLSQGLDLGELILKNTGDTALQIACRAKLVNLVRHYLERGSRCGGRVHVHCLHDRSTALCLVLLQDASRGDFIKRELHGDVYQIVLMLLQHGVNPDIRMTIRFSHPVTVRAIASRHPDPRVRNLFAKATPATEPKGSNLMSGWPRTVPSEDKALAFHELQPEVSFWEHRQYDGFWAFFHRPNAEISNLMDEDRPEYRRTSYEDFTLSASDIAVLEEGKMRWSKRKSAPREPPPLSSFPQLGIPKASAQQTVKKSWAKLSAEASLRVDSAQTPSIGGMGTISQKVKQLEKPVETDLTSSNTATELWTRFAKERVSQSASQPQRKSPRKEGTGMASIAKPSKKKKWEPLPI